MESVLVHKLRPTDIEQGVTPEKALAELRDFIPDAWLLDILSRLTSQCCVRNCVTSSMR